MSILYLCGMAALDVTRYLRATNDGEIPGRTPRTRRLRGAIHSNAGLSELSDDAQRLLSHVRGKIEAMVPSHQQATETSQLVTHEWTSAVPVGAFIDLGNGIYLSSPQFLFLQLGTQLSHVEHVALGMELCGFYSRWGIPTRLNATANDEHKLATYGLKPSTSVQKLDAFVSRQTGKRGAQTARAALRRVLDSSASPMETAIYLLLCLPRSMGGRGLPAPVLNAKVRVTTSSTHEERYPDLYWPTRFVDAEYQSDFAHSGDWARYRDSQREIELEAEKITVLPLTRKQLMDPDGFNAFAISVRRNLGVRSRPLPADWWAKYQELRETLLWTS